MVIKRRLDFATLPFVALVLIFLGFTNAARGQNQTIQIAILNFQDDTGANAPAELGQKLAQDLQQKIATSYKNLLPRLVTGTDAAIVKRLTIDQIAAVGKQNGAKFVIRGGLLTFTAEAAGSDSKITIQLYADIVSADTASLVTTVRVEGSGTQSGAAPQLASLDVKSDQFPSSGAGQAFAAARAQLADQIHQAVSGGTNTTTIETAQTATPSPSPLDTTAAQTPAQTDAAKSAEADTDLQQLITQTEQLLSSSTNPNGPSATAASQSLQALKSALESKATLMQNGKDTSQADQDIATQRQALLAAVAQMTAEASAASSLGTAPTIVTQQPTDQKKGSMQQINDFAGQALSLLQNIQQMRTAVQGLTESSANSTNNTSVPTDQQLGECSGVVTDQNGTAIPSAQVAEQTSGVSVSTDNNGQYDLKGLLANQIAILTVTASGKTMTAQTPITLGQVATLDFQFKPDAPTGTHPTILPPTVILRPPAGSKIGILKGVIRDPQGRPVPRALVSLKGLGVARTDSLGQYQFLNVPAGAQQLTINRPGLQTKTMQVRAAAAASTDTPVQFTASDRLALPIKTSLLALASGVTLTGSVRDGAGNPVAGAKISLVQQASALAVFTGPTGTFVLTNIKSGPYRIAASRVGFDPSLQNVTLSSGVRASVQFRLNEQNSPAVANVLEIGTNRQSIIRGRVVDAIGKPIANATVTLKPTVVNSHLAVSKTNQNGEYQFNTQAGQYEVRVSRDSYQAASQVIDAKGGATTQMHFTMKSFVTDTGGMLKKTGDLLGQVVDAKTGRPVAGAIVSISGQQRTPTNQTGNFAFAKLSPGSYQLTITKAGYSSVQRVISILPGQTIRTSLTLAPQSTAPVGIRRP